MHHDFGWRRPIGLAAHFETDDADITGPVPAAGNLDEAQMRRRLGEFLGAAEGAVADHDDAVGAAAF